MAFRPWFGPVWSGLHATLIFNVFYLWTHFGLEVLLHLESTLCPLQHLAAEGLHKDPWDQASSPFKLKNSMFASSSSKSLHETYQPLIPSLRGNHIPPSYSRAGKHLSPCPDSLPKWRCAALRIAAQPRELQLTHFLTQHRMENVGREASSFGGVDTFTGLRANVLVNEYIVLIVCLLTRACTHTHIFSFWTWEAQQWTSGQHDAAAASAAL